MSDQAVRPGKYVSLTYSITDETGTVLEQTDLPVGYIHGGNTELIGGMDDAVTGKCAGDRVELSLAPGQAFGPHDPSLTFTDSLDNVPPEFRRIGAEVPMRSDTGEVRDFYVTAIEDGTLTVDGNHPLAGKALKVHVQIQDVRDPSAEERSRDSDASAIPSGSLH
jgi:FKBP-type peptidyl-prolyl cis-trans isomerase SlyD